MGALGGRRHPHFDEYWTDSDRKAFLFRADGALAGLALVFTGEPHDQFPGPWTVRQQLTNPAATAFWRKAIRHPFQEYEQGTEIVQSFTTGLQ